MKTEIEIHRAHDILCAIQLGEVPCVVKNMGAMQAALDALCWVLGHDDGKHGCNTALFGENLREIETELAKRGFVLPPQKQLMSRAYSKRCKQLLSWLERETDARTQQQRGVAIVKFDPEFFQLQALMEKQRAHKPRSSDEAHI